MPAARSKTALVLTGGGIMGAAYEIGALTALDRLFPRGFSSRRFDIYLGISAGSVIASLMASRIPADGLFSAISRNERSVFNWQRHDIYQPDWRMLLRTLGELPRKLLQVRRNYRQNRWVFNPCDIPHLMFEQFPAGIFSLEPMQRYLCRAFRTEGVCDDFSRLKCELYIPNTAPCISARRSPRPAPSRSSSAPMKSTGTATSTARPAWSHISTSPSSAAPA
jgi:predicted acylesterase/phospholipase RssA